MLTKIRSQPLESVSTAGDALLQSDACAEQSRCCGGDVSGVTHLFNRQHSKGGKGEIDTSHV